MNAALGGPAATARADSTSPTFRYGIALQPQLAIELIPVTVTPPDLTLALLPLYIDILMPLNCIPMSFERCDLGVLHNCIRSVTLRPRRPETVVNYRDSVHPNQVEHCVPIRARDRDSVSSQWSTPITPERGQERA